MRKKSFTITEFIENVMFLVMIQQNQKWPKTQYYDIH